MSAWYSEQFILSSILLCNEKSRGLEIRMTLIEAGGLARHCQKIQKSVSLHRQLKYILKVLLEI